MKLARFTNGNKAPAIGLVEGDAVTDLTARLADLGSDTARLLGEWDARRAAVEGLRGTADYALSDVDLLAPIARPGKIFGIGLNYADHIAETGRDRPEHQLWFTKAVTAVAGPHQPIELPKVSSKLDYEAELVIVIGKGGRHIPAERAHEAIFGYCAGNDVSVRDWQSRTSQFVMGKTFDTHAPFGPWIVSGDEIDAANLGIRSFVNGEKRQDSNTRHLIFDCAAQVAYLSQAMTLEPGDLIFTGTPGGGGVAVKPAK